jgi:hypothetical protein
MSCWDLPVATDPPPSRSFRKPDTGRYSLVLVDAGADDFEEVCTCVACDERSSASLHGTAGWLVLRRRNGTTLALCPICTDTAEAPERNRR